MKKLLIALFLLASQSTVACDCIIYSDPTAYLPEVDLVFTGKVVELVKAEGEAIDIPSPFDTIAGVEQQWTSITGNRYYAKVIMLENIKGQELMADTMLFVSEFSNCDPSYQLNESYLFFADKQSNGSYMMVHCTPWGTLKTAKQTIKELRKSK